MLFCTQLWSDFSGSLREETATEDEDEPTFFSSAYAPWKYHYVPCEIKRIVMVEHEFDVVLKGVKEFDGKFGCEVFCDHTEDMCTTALNRLERSRKFGSKQEIPDTFRSLSTLNNKGCEQYLKRQYTFAKETFKDALRMLDSCSTQSSFETSGLDATLCCLSDGLRNNLACATCKEGEVRISCIELKILFEKTIKSVISKQEKDREAHESSAKKCSSITKDSYCYQNSNEKLNLAVLIVNYSEASVCSGNYERFIAIFKEILGKLRLFSKDENAVFERLLSTAYARIFFAQGTFKQASVLLYIDDLTIQKDMEGSFGIFGVFYVKQMCRLLVCCGERKKAKNLLKVALQSCHEIYNERHPIVVSVIKEIDELFPTETVTDVTGASEVQSFKSHFGEPHVKHTEETSVLVSFPKNEADEIFPSETIGKPLVSLRDVTGTSEVQSSKPHFSEPHVKHTEETSVFESFPKKEVDEIFPSETVVKPLFIVSLRDVAGTSEVQSRSKPHFNEPHVKHTKEASVLVLSPQKADEIFPTETIGKPLSLRDVTGTSEVQSSKPRFSEPHVKHTEETSVLVSFPKKEADETFPTETTIKPLFIVAVAGTSEVQSSKLHFSETVEDTEDPLVENVTKEIFKMFSEGRSHFCESLVNWTKILSHLYVTLEPQEKKSESIVKTEAVDILRKTRPLSTKKGLRLRISSEDRFYVITALCLLLEELLSLETMKNNLSTCISLIYLVTQNNEESQDIQLYKEWFGLLSFYVNIEMLRIVGKDIPLTTIVFSGRNIPRNRKLKDDLASTGKPLFRSILFDEIAEYEDREEDRDLVGQSRFGYFVFLRSRDLLDINEIRRVNQTVVESMKGLESLLTACYHGNLLIEVVIDVDTANLSNFSVSLHFLKTVFCLVGSGGPLCDSNPKNEPRVHDIYLNNLQRRLTFEKESDLEVFVVVFQHTICDMGIVGLLHKTREKYLFSFKDPPFSLLALRTDARVVYLTLEDVTGIGLGDSKTTNYIDDVIQDCCNKLNVKYSNEPKDAAWFRAGDVQSHESLVVFFDDNEDDDDDLEKAQKAYERLSAEFDYVKSKTQKLTDRMKKLLDKLSKLETRAFLYQQHFVDIISSDKSKAKAVENWIAHRKNSTNDEDEFNLEECLESMSNDELVEMLADIHRPDLVQTRDKVEETCQEKKYESTIGISSYKEPQIYNDDDSEGKTFPNRPCWQFPLNEVAGKTFIKEECTQTDSLSSVDEHTLDQTEPSSLTSDESLGQANFERDRAERQLQRLRVAYDIRALRSSSRGSSSGSSRDSIVSTTPCQGNEVVSSDSTFQELNASGYCSKPVASKYSLVSEISSQDTENISSDGVSESNDSEYWSKPKASKYSVVSGTSRQDTDSISSEGMTEMSNVSQLLSIPKTSKDSIANETSSQETEGISIKDTLKESNVSQLLSIPKTSKDSIASETSSQEMEGISIEDTLQESNVFRLLPKLQFSKDSIASKPSSGVSLSSNRKASLGTPPDSISPDSMPKQDSDTTETVSSGRKPSVDESSSGISSIKEPNFIIRIDQNNENRHPAIPDSKTWLYDTEEYGGRDEEMNASMMLGAEHLKKEEYDDAISYSKKCLGIAQECGDKEAEMNAYYMLGNAYLNTGQRSGAVLYGERCLDIAREYGNKVDEMNACLMLGIAHLNREECDDAISYSEKCLDIAQECGDKATQIKAYRTLGAAHLKKEEYDDAISYSEKCLGIAQECGDKVTEMDTYNTLGNAHLKKEEYDDAISYSKKGLAIAQECGDKVAEMDAYRTLEDALKDNDLKHNMSNCQKGIQLPSQWKEGEYLDMVDGCQRTQNKTFYKPVLLTSEQMVSTQSLFEERTKASGISGVSRKFGAKIKTNEKQAGDSGLLEGNDDSRYVKFSRDCEIATTTKQNSGCDVIGDNRGICEDFGTRKDDENMTLNGGLESTGVLNNNRARTRRDLKALEGNSDSEVCNRGKPSKERARSSIKSIYCKTRTGLFEQVESDGGEVRLKEGALVVPPRKFAFDDVTRTSHYDVRHIMPRDVASQLSESRIACDVTSTSGYNTPREVLTQLNETSNVHVLINHERDESGNQSKFEIAATNPLPEIDEILNAHEHEKSLDKECFKSPNNFQDSSNSRMNEECKAIGTAKQNFLASNENSETSSSFDKVSECLSLPCSLVPRNRTIAVERHDALSTTERTRPRFSTESQNKIDDTCRESLSVIKEIDDSQETASNRVWDLQGARPKIQNNEPLIEKRSDFIVPGVDSSFLARHSIYSRAVPDYGAFLSLPAISERRSFPSLARSWPISNEREVTLPASSISLLGQSLRSTHDQQSSTNNADNTVGATSTDESCPSGAKMRLRSSNELGINGNNLSVGQETNLGNSHLNEIQAVQRGNVTANSTGFVKDQEVDQTSEQSIDPFDQIGASQFAFTSESRYDNILHGWTNNQNSSGQSSMESFNTADSSLHTSLQSLEEKIETTCMTLSQMSESALFNQELERQHPGDEHQTKNDNETVLVAGIDQNMQWYGDNEDISEGDGKGKSGWNKESKGGRAEEETREAKSNNSHSQQSIMVQESGVHAVNLAATLATSLSTQRVSAKTYETLERERRKAVAQERQELRKKEEAENERRLQASKVEQELHSSTPRPASLPVQESTEEGPCSHYKRKCLVQFDCCKEFYPCHRCHNNSDKCQEENKKALDSTHLKCLNCLTEQEITKDSHHCKNCKIQLSDYFCGICKHFTGIEKKPYHCEDCGICRVHRDRSFHCKVCNVCLDNRLYNNHKCRENSGHDECCICLEDAFGGCQILPCSHKVHRECAVAMLKNGVRKCPICRCPLYQ